MSLALTVRTPHESKSFQTAHRCKEARREEWTEDGYAWTRALQGALVRRKQRKEAHGKQNVFEFTGPSSGTVAFATSKFTWAKCDREQICTIIMSYL
jgi:hypothetical protein